MDINRVTLVGRLTRDPEQTKLESGKSVTRLGLATNFRHKPKDGEAQEIVEFHNVALWGQLGEKAKAYLSRGKRVLVEGRLHYYAPRADGDDDAWPRAEIIGDTLVLLDPKPRE